MKRTEKTVVFDLRALQIGHENRGIGMVIRSFIENLKDASTNYLFYIFDDTDPIKELKIDCSGLSYEYVTTPRLKTSIKSVSDVTDIIKLTFHSFKELRRYRVDTFVQFDFNLGAPRFFGTKIVTVAYDLIPLIMSKEYLPTPFFAFSRTAGRRAKLRAFAKAANYRIRAKISYKVYRRSHHVIAISNTVRDSFIEKLHIKPKKISVAELAPVTTTSSLDDSILKKHDLTKKPYIFYIGGPDSRKRVEEVVYAFNITKGRGSDIKLVLAGKEFSDVDTIPSLKIQAAIKASPYKDEIILAGFITDKQKNSLYAHAHAFVFCSIYEGFGLPVLEAHALSCPVIAYSNSAIKELSKDSALLVETNNYVDIAAGIGALFDESLRQQYIKKGKSTSSRYSWTTFAEEFKKVI